MQTKLARNFFSAPWEFPGSVCKKTFMSRTWHFLRWFQLWYFAHCARWVRRTVSSQMDANKTPANFFQRPLGVSFKFWPKSVHEPNFAFFFGDFNFDILPTVPDVFHFLCFIFVGGLPHKKGVCIRSLVFNCFYHYDSKWRVKYAALFVVGALSHAIWMQRKLSRNFLQRFVGVSSNFLRKTFMNRILHFFLWFQLWYFVHCAWCFSFFVFHFLLGGYLIKRAFVYEV